MLIMKGKLLKKILLLIFLQQNSNKINDWTFRFGNKKNGEIINVSGARLASKLLPTDYLSPKLDSSVTSNSSSPIVSNYHATIGSHIYQSTVILTGSSLHVFVNGNQTKYLIPIEKFISSGDLLHSGCIAPMAGKVVKIQVSIGDQVKKGQAVAIMEAMKMEHVLRAPYAGIVSAVFFKEGAFVEGGKTVVTVNKEEGKKK